MEMSSLSSSDGGSEATMQSASLFASLDQQHQQPSSPLYSLVDKMSRDEQQYKNRLRVCIFVVVVIVYCLLLLLLFIVIVYCYCLLLLFIVIVYCYCLLLLFIVIVYCYCLLLLLLLLLL